MKLRLPLLLLVLSLRVHGADLAPLRTSMEEGAELKWNIGGQSGLCPEILRALMRKDPELHISWSLRPLPQKRLVVEVERGQLDLACALGRTPERERQFAIPDVALYNNTLVAAVRKGDTLQINSLGDLKKLAQSDIILLNAGARLTSRLHEMGIDHVNEGTAHPADNLNKLAVGRGRIFLYHEPGMAWEIQRAGLDGKLQVMPAALSVDQHYLLLSRKLPAETVARIGAALARLKADGDLRIIARHWSPRFDVAGAQRPRPTP